MMCACVIDGQTQRNKGSDNLISRTSYLFPGSSWSLKNSQGPRRRCSLSGRCHDEMAFCSFFLSLPLDLNVNVKSLVICTGDRALRDSAGRRNRVLR